MKRKLTAIGWIVAILPILSICSPSPSNALAATSNEEREIWEIILIQGSRLGYVHTTIKPITESGRKLVQTESTARISARRGNDTIQQVMQLVSVETPDGQLLRFKNEMGMGPKPIISTGQINGNQLDVEMTAEASAPKKITIPWSADYLGPFADRQSLLKKPMQPGEHRKLKPLMAEFLQVADVDLTAKDYEPCKLRAGVYNLLRIEAVARLANNQKIEQTLWTDRIGNLLKTHMPAGQIEMYRVSKAEALDKADVAKLDLMSSTMVKVDTPLANSLQTKEVRYRVHLKGSDPAGVFVTGPTQAIKSIDANTAEITVYAIRPGQSDGNPKAPADPPTDDDLRPNAFVQSDDPLIVADAKKAAGDEKDPWRIAVALERFVQKEVKTKNFSQAFLSAAEVAKSREGDCSEHAVFLTALCRARGIPARAAMGLVYFDQAQAFFYHMWTEVYIDKRWIPIDGTLALGGIGAAHLKIAQTNLKDASAYSSFLPVIQVLGRLSIKVVDAK